MTFSKQFLSAGHTHAGVLLMLSLVYWIYPDRTGFARATRRLAEDALMVAILAQSGGFFLHTCWSSHPAKPLRARCSPVSMRAASLQIDDSKVRRLRYQVA